MNEETRAKLEARGWKVRALAELKIPIPKEKAEKKPRKKESK